jgi:hypothetical protein
MVSSDHETSSDWLEIHWACSRTGAQPDRAQWRARDKDSEQQVGVIANKMGSPPVFLGSVDALGRVDCFAVR